MPEEVKKSLIGDLAGLSEPLKKLFEVVSSGAGRLTGAMWLDKRDADNEAYKILKVGSAQTQVAVERMKAVAAIGSGSAPQVQKLTLTGNEVNAELSEGQQAVLALKERGDNRVAYQNLLHQLNTEQIVGFAAEELAQEGTVVSDEPVDDNWKARYFSIAQDISGEQMQILWGKILAGEISNPNSFSLRTLEVLRNLTKAEAEIFDRACNYLIINKGSAFAKHFSFFKDTNTGGVFNDIGYNEVIALIECGLIKPADSPGFTFIPKNGNVETNWQIGDKVVMISGEGLQDSKIIFPVYLLSNAGREISTLIKREFSMEYLLKINETFKKKGLKTEYMDFRGWTDDNQILAGGTRVLVESD
jgi:uncharacterized repeat protein (TIGR03899 family)